MLDRLFSLIETISGVFSRSFTTRETTDFGVHSPLVKIPTFSVHGRKKNRGYTTEQKVKFSVSFIL